MFEKKSYSNPVILAEDSDIPQDILALFNDVSRYEVPSFRSRIIKDECAFSCDTAHSPDGLFVNLKTFYAVGRNYVDLANQKTPAIFLNIREKYTVKGSSLEHQSPKTVYDIIDEDKLLTVTSYSLVDHNHEIIIRLNSTPSSEKQSMAISGRGLCEKLVACLNAVISADHEAASRNPVIGDDFSKTSSHPFALKQIPDPPKIIPGSWKCASCGRTTNQWLHLSDGYIGCGRKIYGLPDTGCLTGEEGAAVRHHLEAPSDRPLAVKLGTLSASNVEVFSYLEDDMVDDPDIQKHLLHFGIDLSKTQKTEKTVAELELAYNTSRDLYRREIEKDIIHHIREPNYVGLLNLGQTCYLNVCLQLLNHMDLATSCFDATLIRSILRNNEQILPHESLLLQISKMMISMKSGIYYEQQESLLQSLEKNVLTLYLQNRPSVYLPTRLFKDALGQTAYFDTLKQQDAIEVFQFLISQLKAICLNDYPDLWNALTCVHFQLKQTLSNIETEDTRFSCTDDFVLSLPIPQKYWNVRNEETEISVKGSQYESVCTLEDCFSEWASVEYVELNNPKTRQPELYAKTLNFSKFPVYLLIQLKRFCFSEKGQPAKINTSVKAPEKLDLTEYFSDSLDGTDINLDLLPPHMNEVAKKLVDTGYSIYQILTSLAIHSRVSENLLFEAYPDWIDKNKDIIHVVQTELAHLFAKYQLESDVLTQSGFNPEQIKAAMISSKSDEERALEWLLSGEAAVDTSSTIIREFEEKVMYMSLIDKHRGRYKHMGCICHIGSGLESGHYVYYANDPQRSWILYDDDKVSCVKSHKIDQAYLHLYKLSSR